ncbi:MAG: DUF3426 domain-containing protein [Proteobacteria bacterium]|nr:DUF3426 domain-containing protein [Pseudomonadota bacterium]NIS71072.1 DUF3426 domain-containing protein [Pseudomonadota bacterium]
MLVTCDSCEASFRVDDARIPDKGIKVRCSKCKHVFMVKREVPEDFMAEFEDFESFHRDQIEREGPSGEEKPEAVSEQLARIPEEPARGISFEEFMAKEEPFAEQAEPELPAEEPTSGQLEGPEVSIGEKVGPEEIDSQASLGLEESEAAGALSEETLPEMEETKLSEEALPEMEETKLSEETLPEMRETELSEETLPEMEETKLSVEDYFREEMEKESESRASEAPLDSLKDKRLEDLVKEKELGRGPVRRRSSFRAILFLVILLSLGVVGYLWWQNRGTSLSLPIEIGPSIKAVTGKVSELWEDILGFRKGSLELSGLEGYEDEIGQHRVYIIKGNVANKSRRARRSVKLRVIILDQAGNRIKDKEIYGGNVFTREELEKLSPRFLTGEEVLEPKRPKDMVLEAHQNISFMAIFSGLPREGKSFKVEILEAPGV